MHVSLAKVSVAIVVTLHFSKTSIEHSTILCRKRNKLENTYAFSMLDMPPCNNSIGRCHCFYDKCNRDKTIEERRNSLSVRSRYKFGSMNTIANSFYIPDER